MSEIRIPLSNGLTLVLDTKDIGHAHADFTHHPGLTVDGPGFTTAVLPSGNVSLTVHIDLKHADGFQFVSETPRAAEDE